MNEELNGSGFAKEDMIYVAAALLAIPVMWLLPTSTNVKIALAILGFGIVFDLLSLYCHVMTILTGKYSSGFPVVGLLFYTLFLLTSQFSPAGWHETSPGRVILYKVADALILLSFHIGCQLPMRFQKSREHYE